MLDKELFNMLGKDKKYVWIITAISVVGMLFNVGVTASICYILSLAYTKCSDTSTYIMYIGIALLCVIFSAIISIINGRLKCTLGNRVKQNLREKAYKKLLDLGINGTKEGSASLTQMIIEGVEQIDIYYSRYLPSFFYAMIAPLVLFIICMFFEWKVGLVLIVCLPIIPISIMLVSKYAKKIFAKYWGKYTSMGDAFLDNLQGMKDLKIFDADGRKQIETAEKSEEFRVITMKVLVMQLWSLSIIEAVSFLGAGIAIIVAINSAMTSNPLNGFVALFLILLSAEFFLPMKELSSAFHVAMSGTTAGKRIKQFLELPVREYGTNKVDKIENISLNDLSFSYNDDEKYVLNRINMTFKKGYNAIIGESGSGKSTIVSLLLGSYKQQKGELLINSLPLDEYNKESYFEHIAQVSYNTFIFNASIRENFKLAKSNVTDSEIYDALKLVNLKDFIDEMGGLDYVVYEDSENISGGQRQRLALAINLIAPKDVYIFDEATSNIDVESEAIIIDNIKKLSSDKIVILISHRLQNAVIADNIYMLNDGVICEKGTHSELIALNGEYARSFNRQQELENGYKEVAING